MTTSVGSSAGGWPPRFYTKTYDAAQEATERSMPWIVRRLTGGAEQLLTDKEYLKSGVSEANRVGRNLGLTPEVMNSVNKNKGVQFLFNNDTLKNAAKPWVENHAYVKGLMEKADRLREIDLKESRNSTSPIAQKTLLGGSIPALEGASAMGYTALFGLDSKRLQHLHEKGLSRTEIAKTVFSPKNMLTNANKNLIAGETGGSATKAFFKKVVVNQNVQNVVEPLKDGRLLFGGLMGMAWLMMIGNAVSVGMKEYNNLRAHGRGVVTSAWEGFKSFGQKMVRSFISWEIASIGFSVGVAALKILMPHPTKAAGFLFSAGTMLTGIASGVGLAVASDKFVLSKLFPDPPEQKQT